MITERDYSAIERGFARSDANRRVRFSGPAHRGWAVRRSSPTLGPGSRSWNRWAMAAAGIGLVVLIIVVTVGSLVTSNAAGSSTLAVRLGIAYGHAASAIAAEESLERKYRLQPGTATRAAHAAAEASLDQAMRQVADLGDGVDRHLATVVLRE